MVKKEEKETIDEKILNKLGKIEKELTEKVSNLETAIKKIDESSKLITDDQMFFGFVFSLALLALTLPTFDLSTLFESFGFEISDAGGWLSTKDIIVILLLIACVVRYVVTFVEKDKKNKLRKLSVSFLLLAFYVVMMDLFIRVLGDVFGSIIPSFKILSPALFVCLCIIFGYYVEKKWYKQYSLSDDSNRSEPSFVSLTFSFVGLFVMTLYVLAQYVAYIVPFSDVVLAVIVIISIIITILLFILIIWITERVEKKWN